MAVAYLHEFPGGSHEHAQRLSERLEQQGNMPPPGGLSHAEGPMEGGWWAFDIWESEQSAQEFYDQRLRPILQELGLGEPKRRQFPVHWYSDQPQGEISKRGIAVQLPVVSRQVASTRMATALALTSMGALAVGALAVGRLTIKALRVQDGRIERLSIQELELGTLRVRELVTEQRPLRLWRRVG